MARQLSSKILIMFLILCSSFSAWSRCEEVSFQSQDVEKVEKAETCFLNDPTYFISQNCQDLSCSFAKELKSIEFEVEAGMRPGAILCEKLGGLLESVTYDRVKFTVRRCIFEKDKTFISLNLLESWDGKVFKGPSIPVDL